VSKTLGCCTHLLCIGKHNTMVCLKWLEVLTSDFHHISWVIKGIRWYLGSWLLSKKKGIFLFWNYCTIGNIIKNT
jgi:uncharacterized membrane protein